MLRLGIRVSEDIGCALLKIQHSKEYEKFLEEFRKAKIGGDGNVSMKEYPVFEVTRDRVLEAIYESTYKILMRLIGPHKSTEERELYRKRAIQGYQRHMRTLLEKHCLKILPEIYKFLETELDEGFDYFITNLLLIHF